jgi:hypothetical protein
MIASVKHFNACNLFHASSKIKSNGKIYVFKNFATYFSDYMYFVFDVEQDDFMHFERTQKNSQEFHWCTIGTKLTRNISKIDF